jgi:bifunctional DNA-binding transcriptional regulator/antitoxin component of YhaV-PrlF toxin-antitoxin module
LKKFFEIREGVIIIRPKNPKEFVEEFIDVPKKLKKIDIKKLKKILKKEYEIP